MQWQQTIPCSALRKRLLCFLLGAIVRWSDNGRLGSTELISLRTSEIGTGFVFGVGLTLEESL